MVLKGRLIVVTGVSRGLGRAMTEKFIAFGHTVLGCARSRDEIHALSRHFSEPHGFHAVDVCSDEEVNSWAALLLSCYGVPDLLINNAAIINRNAPLWEVSAGEFSKVIDTNIKGTANVIRHFVPAMIRKKRGVIVNLSSGWGRSADAEVAPYCATKWAIEGLTQALAQEVPSGVAAVSLNPGIINTDMLRSCFGSASSSYPSAQDWAERAVPYLLGLSAKDNGKVLTVPES